MIIVRGTRIFGRRFASSAVVFDVDGVLIRGAETVESAPGVLRGLRERDVPFMLMTNGGGYHESTRAKKLTERFGVQIDDDQIIQSHTPMKELVPEYKDEPVLLVGKRYEHLLHLAKEYGFKYPVSIEQYHKEFPLLYPDMDPVDCEPLSQGLDLKNTPIRAVLALTDPLMWGRELQICCDVLGSNGLPGSVLKNTQGVPLYSSCADFVYAAEYEASPRFGSGAFVSALEALYEELHEGNALSDVTRYGKPWHRTFNYAYRRLQDTLGENNSLKRIYMVGDNAETDIKGANDAGDPWFSVLTRSGLFKGSGNHAEHPGREVIDDVAGLLDIVDAFEKHM